MRIYIEKNSGSGQTQIKVKMSQKESQEFHHLNSWYENPKEREGCIFGRVEMSGDNSDGWARHIYQIAIKKSGGKYKILGYFYKVYGWQYSNNGESPIEWKKQMIKKAKLK